MPVNFQDLFGWQDKPQEVEAVLSTAPSPYMGPVAQAICGSGKGKAQLLYKFLEKVLGKFPVLEQAIGDCVSFGLAGAINVLAATEIHLNGDFESWGGLTSTEDIYGGSRVLIGNGSLGNGDGSIGAWAVKYACEYGTLVRKKYDNIDLSVYSGARAREWGRPRVGPPKQLLTYAREHKIKTYSLVKTYEEVRDAIYNGYPVTIASNQGFSNVRDKEGFLKPQGSWPHQMFICAVDDEYKRPGVLIMNSWGPNWVSGPKRLNQPDGSFWCDAEVLERNILRGQDSWAISGFQGYPSQKLDWGDLFK